MQLPMWMQMLQAGSTLGIAMFAAIIARGQWRAAHDRLMIDLFDRRMAAYCEITRKLALINARGFTSVETYISLHKVVREAEFLFGAAVTTLLCELLDVVELHAGISSKLRDPDLAPDARSEYTRKRKAALTDLSGLQASLTSELTPYLRLERSNLDLRFWSRRDEPGAFKC